MTGRPQLPRSRACTLALAPTLTLTLVLTLVLIPTPTLRLTPTLTLTLTLTPTPTKVEGEDFRVISGADGKRAALQLNDAGLLPKVPLDRQTDREGGRERDQRPSIAEPCGVRVVWRVIHPAAYLSISISAKVPLTSAWLKALNYSLCGAAPQSESHFACVCTPYVFNR